MLRDGRSVVFRVVLAASFAICTAVAGSAAAADQTAREGLQLRQGVERVEDGPQLGARRTKVDTDNKPQIDCANLPDSVHAVPADVAAVCGREVLGGVSGRGSTDTGFAYRMGRDQLVTFTLDNFSGQTVVGPESGDFFAVDFDATASILYAIDNASQMLGTFDLTTGAFTAIGACAPAAGDTWTGLTIGVDNVAWASSVGGGLSRLYTVDLGTGAATEVTTVPGLLLLIDIAMDTNGVLWGHDIETDSIYTIDTTTGAETLVGATGYDARWAQGMDFDYGDGSLYLFLYNDTTGTFWGTVDQSTGAFSVLDTSTGEFAGGIQVAASERLGCATAMVEFEEGIPLTFTVVDNDGGGVVWTTTGTQECPRSNDTNGSGLAACVDTDTAGSIPYDTELVSNLFSLDGASAATLTASIYYYDVTTGSNDVFEIDLFDGVTWNNLLSWDEDHQPEDISLDISAYAGMSDLQVRFRYSGDGDDWWVLVDDVKVSCRLSAIALTKTVGTDPVTCGTTDEITVATGTDVTYCYTVENTGNVTLGLHDLVDDQLGILLSGHGLDLGPGETAQLLQTNSNMTVTTTNTATWTAYNAGSPDTAVATDTATVIVAGPASVVCNGPIVEFDAGVPTDWSVTDDIGNGLVWLSTGAVGYPTDCGEGNYTNGSGKAVGASSDVFGAAGYDTSLVTSAIDLSGQAGATLSFSANFQQIADTFDVDVSIDGGTMWTNVLRWQEDHGGFRAPPGEDVMIDLSPFVGYNNVLVRWRYYNPSSSAFDWYVVLDDVGLTCFVPVELQSFSTE